MGQVSTTPVIGFWEFQEMYTTYRSVVAYLQAYLVWAPGHLLEYYWIFVTSTYQDDIRVWLNEIYYTATDYLPLPGRNRSASYASMAWWECDLLK